MKKVLLTGASGKIASALYDLPYDLVLTDIRPLEGSTVSIVQGSLTDEEFCDSITKGMNCIIHLAGASSVESSWDKVLGNNIIATRNLFASAVKNGVERIVFASSNHVLGGYEEAYSKEYYSGNHKTEKIGAHSLFWPDSEYGVSKLFGEGLGRHYHSRFGIGFIALRIGSVLETDHDHPYGYAELRKEELNGRIDPKEYNTLVNRLKGTWLSRRDFRQLVMRAVESDQAFGIYNGVSDNYRTWFTLDDAKKELNYSPEDNGENHTNPPL